MLGYEKVMMRFKGFAWSRRKTSSFILSSQQFFVLISVHDMTMQILHMLKLITIGDN